MSMKVAVTGSGGYVGSYLLPELREHDVTCIDRTASRSGRRSIIADIRDQEALLAMTERFDAFIHLAAIVGSYNEQLNYEVNVRGTDNILELARRSGARRFVYISTVSAKRNRRGPYGRTKSEAERLVRASGLDYTILRPSMLIGRESLGLNRILRNMNRFPIFTPLVGFGNYTRQPLYIRDFAKLIRAVLMEPKTHGKLYDVGGDTRLSFRDLVKLIHAMEGERRLLIPVPVCAVSVLARIAERTFTVPPFTSEHVMSLTENTEMDIGPIETDVGFHPTPLDEALRTILSEIHACPPQVLPRGRLSQTITRSRMDRDPSPMADSLASSSVRS